jgi:hypothetical protein
MIHRIWSLLDLVSQSIWSMLDLISCSSMFQPWPRSRFAASVRTYTALPSLVLRVAAPSPDQWLRITAQSAFDLRAIVTVLLRRFRVIAAQHFAGRCMVPGLPSSPAATAIPKFLLGNPPV